MILKFAERGFVVFVLFLSTSPFLSLLGRGTEETAEGYLPLQALWFGVYLVVLFLSSLRWKQFLHTVLTDKLLLLLVGIALISVFWSINPFFTVRRSMALVGTTLFGMYLASRYSLKGQLRLLSWAFGIATVLSMIFVVALPSYGISGMGALGIYHQKNVLGTTMSLGAVVFLLNALDARRHRWLGWALFFISTTLLLLSTAKGALVTFLTVLILLPFFRALRLPFNIRVPFLIAVILIGSSVATVIVSNAEAILTSMGKDITLTGRTALWFILFEKFIKQRPWLGYGYGAFWVGGNAKNVWIFLPWTPSHAHNGFLGLTLDLGVIGLLIFGISFIVMIFNAFSWVKLTKSAVSLWPLAVLVFVFLSNLTESVVLAPNRLHWILYVSISLSMAAERVLAKKLAIPAQLSIYMDG